MSMTIKELHNKAMKMAELYLGTKNINRKTSISFAKTGMKCEAEAARRCLPIKENELSRSILFRSAATLAFWAGDIKEAKKLIKEGISGFTPDEIEREFRDLEEKIKEQL